MNFLTSKAYKPNSLVLEPFLSRFLVQHSSNLMVSFKNIVCNLDFPRCKVCLPLLVFFQEFFVNSTQVMPPIPGQVLGS